MPRSPILQAAMRLFRDIRLSRDAGAPLDAVEETRRATLERAEREGRDLRGELRSRLFPSNASMSRRGVLAGAGAAALGLALPRPAAAWGWKKPKVVIVGGGIAGMSCGLTLADQGVPFTVYEASNRTGGRMRSIEGYFSQGLVAESCGELLDSSNETIFQLASRFDLPVDDLLDAEPIGSAPRFHFFGQVYSMAQFQADMIPVYDAVTADLTAAPFPQTRDDHTAAGEVLDGMSIHEWIETRVPGGHGSPLGRLLDVAYAAEYGRDTTELSALNLVILLGYQPAPDPFAVLGLSDGRYHIRGGNQRLPHAIASHLGYGDTIKLGHRLERIALTSSGRYVLHFAHGLSTVTVLADHVVLALPFSVLRHIDYEDAGFDALKTQIIEEQGASRNHKLQLEFTQRVWTQQGGQPQPGNGMSYTDRGSQWTWDVSRAQAGAAGILNFYGGGSATDALLTNAAFSTTPSPTVAADALTVLGQIAPVFPGLAQKWSGKATLSIPHKNPLIRCGYSTNLIGQYTTFAGYERVRQGNVHFCGEHTSTDFQGFMEGAAIEGIRAGEDVAALVGSGGGGCP